MRVYKVTITLLLLFAFSSVSKQNELLVKTKSGTVEGIQLITGLGSSVNAYYGIPFAEPPIGDLRFKSPVPVIPAQDVITANKKSKACLQVFKQDDFQFYEQWALPLDGTSEDCLYLNVWVPNPKPKDAAVMVWIHGGAFKCGSANLVGYDGQLLAGEGVIVVSMNYRLSVFGFLSLDSEEAPGNLGLMDQALALRWVQDNIEAFGGDPKRVTIFGESAGAASVGYHLLLPSSQGLFQRAILQSGAAQAVWASSSKSDVTKLSKLFAQSAGCVSLEPRDIVKCLRNKDAEDLVAIGLKMGSDLVVFSPSVDGHFLPGHPSDLQNKLKFNKGIDILLGSTNDDGFFIPLIEKALGWPEDFFTGEEGFTDYLKSVLPSENPMVISTVKFLYTDWETEPTNWRRAITDFATDFFFTCPVVNTADHAVANGNNVFLYELHERPSSNPFPKWSRVSHVDDVPFVFGHPRINQEIYTPREAVFSERMMKYWTQFVKTGNPNSGDKINWPAYTVPEKRTLFLHQNEHIMKGVRLQRCAFFNQLLPNLKQMHHEDKFLHCDTTNPKTECFKH